MTRATTRLSAAALLAAAPAALHAQGQPEGAVNETLGNEVIDETAPAVGPSFSLDVSGQVDIGLMLTEDGDRTDLFVVDNDSSSTRLTIVGTSEWQSGAELGFRLQGELQLNGSNVVSQDDKDDVPEPLINDRIWEVFAGSPRFGLLAIGQGSTASDGVSEIDLSGTGVVGYSSTADLGAGLRLRSDGALTDTPLGSAFSNFDGLGREARIRYDTPEFGGATLAFSVTDQDSHDVALTFERGLGEGSANAVTLAGGIAWSESEDDIELINGSLSILHDRTGLNVTIAAARREGVDGASDPELGYIKLGWRSDDLVGLGGTAFSIDYARNDDVGADGSEGDAVGVQAVQTVDRLNMELFAGYRRFDVDRADADFEDVDVFTLGGRYQF